MEWIGEFEDAVCFEDHATFESVIGSHMQTVKSWTPRLPAVSDKFFIGRQIAWMICKKSRISCEIEATHDFSELKNIAAQE